MIPPSAAGEGGQGAEGGAFYQCPRCRGVAAVAQAALRAGVELNQRRRDRGMLPRGPGCHWVSNVGKSALINPAETASSGKCCLSWRNAAAALDTHL